MSIGHLFNQFNPYRMVNHQISINAIWWKVIMTTLSTSINCYHQLLINCECNQSMIDVINDYNQFNQQRSDKKIKRTSFNTYTNTLNWMNRRWQRILIAIPEKLNRYEEQNYQVVTIDSMHVFHFRHVALGLHWLCANSSLRNINWMNCTHEKLWSGI